jgi:hypothetical protein
MYSRFVSCSFAKQPKVAQYCQAICNSRLQGSQSAIHSIDPLAALIGFAALIKQCITLANTLKLSLSEMQQ